MVDDSGDFFVQFHGQIAQSRWRRNEMASRLMDALFDERLRLSGALRSSAKWAAGIERQSVLVAAVDVPARSA